MATVSWAGKPRTRSRPKRGGQIMKTMYPHWFYLPGGLLFLVFFALPTFASFYFSLTRWTLFDVDFIGLANFVQFFREPRLYQSFINTLIFGFITSFAKIVIALALALVLTSRLFAQDFLRAVIFFPVLASTIGIGITFKALLDPYNGMINVTMGWFGVDGPGWLTDPKLALYSVAMVEVWKTIGISTLIYIAGLVSIPQEYYEAARVDGAGWWSQFRHITIPLVWPATGTVIILSLISGLRSFDLIWAMTGGGPGFASDVIASVIYKQYQAGYYGLSTAGNVILFMVVLAIMIPVSRLVNRRGVEV